MLGDDPRRADPQFDFTTLEELDRQRSQSRSASKQHNSMNNRWVPSNSRSESYSPRNRNRTPPPTSSHQNNGDELTRKRDALRAQLESSRNGKRDGENKRFAARQPDQRPLTPQTRGIGRERAGVNDRARRDDDSDSDLPAKLTRDISRDELRDRPRRLMSRGGGDQRRSPAHHAPSHPEATPAAVPSTDGEETSIFDTQLFKVWKEIATNTNMTLKRTASLEIYVPESVYEIVHSDDSATIREIEGITNTKLKWEGLRDGYYNLKMTGPCLAIHSAHMILIQIIISQVTKEKEKDSLEKDKQERAKKLLSNYAN